MGEDGSKGERTAETNKRQNKNRDGRGGGEMYTD